MYSRDAEREERLRDERVERACLEEAGLLPTPKTSNYPTHRKGTGEKRVFKVPRAPRSS
jgi:hypothetical protein